MPAPIDIRTLEPELRAIVSEHVEGATLLIVDSVQAWALANGVPENNVLRQAKAFPGRQVIVMVACLTEGMARSSSSIFNIGPTAHEALAHDLTKYALFLLFHEIAHLKQILDERGADEWALTKLNKHLALKGEGPIS